MPLISVIVPVYKTEIFLPRCVDSILTQSFIDFELLLINDGSPDNSEQLCNSYAKQDSRIRVFHKKNEGLSATREFGIIHARGEYIQFVDSDDWIESDMLSKMYKIIIQTKPDIIGCNFIEEYPKYSVYRRTYYEHKDAFFRDILSGNWGVIWKLLVKKSLYIDNNIHFPTNIRVAEDYFATPQLLYYARKVVCIDEYFYHYIRYNTNSLINSITIEKTLDQIKVTKYIEEFLKSKDIFKLYKKELHQRKLRAKSGLLYLNPKLWLEFFPEVNQNREHLSLNWKTKLVYKLANLRLFFLIKFLFCLKNICSQNSF